MKLRRSSENMEKATRRFLSHNWHLPSAFCFLVFAFCLLLSGISCAPSYPTEKASKAIVDILKNEYHLDVRAKLKDSTLGVLFSVDNLVDSRLNLNPERLEGIEHVALTMHRVGLSTEKEIQFYTIIAQDPISSVELTLSGYFLDVKRVRLLDISRDEYLRRVIRDLRYNAELLGENTLRQFFTELSRQKAELALEKYYSKTVTPQELKVALFPTHLIALPDTTEYILQLVQTKRISPTKALVFCQTREYYALQPQFSSLMSVFPQGFTNEYLFVIDSALYPKLIERMVPKYALDEQGRIIERPLRGIFEEYPNIIPENDRFYLEEFTLPSFLTKVIEHRIRESIGHDLNKEISLRSVQGDFDSDKRDFTFSLIALPVTQGNTDQSQSKLFEASLRVTADVLKGYWFKDYAKIHVVDVLSGSSISINRDSLEQFRLKKIGIQELLQNSYLSPFNP